MTPHVVAAARALAIGLRASALYPAGHPALGLAIDRLAGVTGDVTRQGPLLLGVTPHALIVNGAPVTSTDPSVADCARRLHDLDLLQVSFVAPAPGDVVQALLRTLTLEASERRRRGGPAAIWNEQGHPQIVLEQIDYQDLLEREVEDGPARRDALWQSIVQSIVAGRRTFTEAEQKRLLEISREGWAIGELADDCRAAYCAADGSPLLTTQAATVLAVYRHIAATVGVLEPHRADETLGRFALATSSLEPALALEVLQAQESAADARPIMAALKNAFDEHQIALLLARALATAGRATTRLSQMLDTLAPDSDRRQRVLKLADRLLTERDFGATRPISDIRSSLQELLLSYDETPYVSASYRQSMDASGARAAELAARDLPPELDEWLDTLAAPSVRALSAQLLIDLLMLETDEGRATETAGDLGTFAQEVLLAGAYVEARRIVHALRTAAARPEAVGGRAMLAVIDRIGRSPAMHEAVALVGELDEADAASVAALVAEIGAPCAPALIAALGRDHAPTTARVIDMLVALGPEAIGVIAHGLDEHPWFVQRALAQALGAIGTPASVPPLQGLLRRPDPRVLAEVIRALSGIPDPSANRALHMVLRAASGTMRQAVVQALVALRDARVVPMLTRILDDSDAYGRDFALVLESIDAVATFTDDRAVRSLGALARERRWLAPRRTRAVRQRAIAALRRTGSDSAAAMLALLATQGDWQLRRLLRQAARGERP